MQTRFKFKERIKASGVETAALADGFTPLQARILAGRLRRPTDALRSLVHARLSELDKPHALPDCEKAAEHIARSLMEGRPIAIVTDHDADGATSHAIIRLCLEAWKSAPGQVTGYISHRMREGYGVSHALVDRMLPELRAGTCVITADQGSTDEARIALLRSAGHDVVVTDHHGVPDEGPPPSALAVVNPARVDSRFPDSAIAGCHTALLVMAAVRERLEGYGWLPADAPRASAFLDICAVGTLADASSLGESRNNRAVVRGGLQLMNSKPRPCWNALRRLLGKRGHWTASDVAFQVATRINARGRLGDAALGVEFLCSEDEYDAYRIALELDANNRERRRIERANTTNAWACAREAVDAGRIGLCLWLGEQGHAGVHGICASRIVEGFGRPTICLSPVAFDDQLVTGSIRSTAKVHVRDTLAEIQQRWPGLLVGAGGHAGAGGLRLRKADIPVLADAWDQCVRRHYADGDPEPELAVDGDLGSPSLRHIREIGELEPFGRSFEAPVFVGSWEVENVRAIGDGTHLKLSLARNGERYDAVWFGANAGDGGTPVASGQRARLAYSLDVSTFRGEERLQLIVRGLEA